MAKKSRMRMSRNYQIGLTLGIIGIIIGGSIGTLFLLQYLGVLSIVPTPTVTPPEGFSIQVLDRNGRVLQNDEFNYTIYHSTTLEWADMEKIDDGTSLDSISTTDWTTLTVDFNHIIINVTGRHAHDDNIWGEDFDWGPRSYYERWFVLDITGPNTLIMAETPSSTGLIVFNSSSFSPIVNLTDTPVTFNTNFTVVAGINQTQAAQGAAWMSGPNYRNGIEDKPGVLIEFNDTAELGSLSVAGATVDRVNSTAIRFDLDLLDGAGAVLNFEWDPTLGQDLQVDAVSIYFGDTLQAVAP